jgi:hypothetical protein
MQTIRTNGHLYEDVHMLAITTNKKQLLLLLHPTFAHRKLGREQLGPIRQRAQAIEGGVDSGVGRGA